MSKTVKGLARWSKVPHLYSVQTYGPEGDWDNRENAERHLKALSPRNRQPIVDCTITFTIPQKGKRK